MIGSVVDPNTLSLDPDPECWPNLVTDQGFKGYRYVKNFEKNSFRGNIFSLKNVYF